MAVRRTAAVGVLALGLALGGVACSDDDGDGNPELEAPDVDVNQEDGGGESDVQTPDVEVNEEDDGDG